MNHNDIPIEFYLRAAEKGKYSGFVENVEVIIQHVGGNSFTYVMQEYDDDNNTGNIEIGEVTIRKITD